LIGDVVVLLNFESKEGGD